MRLQLISQEVWNGLRRNLSVVVSVVLVTFISLSFVGAAILLQMQINQMKGFWYDRAQVGIYFCGPADSTETCTQTAATDEQIQAVRDVLDSGAIAPYVAHVEFEDREQAYQHFMEQFGGTASAEFASPETMNEALWVRPATPADADLSGRRRRRCRGCSRCAISGRCSSRSSRCSTPRASPRSASPCSCSWPPCC